MGRQGNLWTWKTNPYIFKRGAINQGTRQAACHKSLHVTSWVLKLFLYITIIIKKEPRGWVCGKFNAFLCCLGTQYLAPPLVGGSFYNNWIELAFLSGWRVPGRPGCSSFWFERVLEKSLESSLCYCLDPYELAWEGEQIIEGKGLTPF